MNGEMKKSKVVSNLFWRFAERSGAQMVSFVVSMILARLLNPDIYGTVALITVFTAILQVFVDSGLGNALIQKKYADDLDFSTVFYTNVVFCVVLYGLMCLISPGIAKFYNNKSLVPMIRVLSLTVVIAGIKNVQQAYVSKNFLFKKFFFATLSGTIIAAIVGIVMAYNGFGVWALISQQIINASVDTIILWLTVKWRPKKIFSFKRLKELFGFGSKLLLSSLLDTAYRNLRQLVIGKKYSSADLACYERGDKFPNVIVVNINSSLDSVLLPTMADKQDDIHQVKALVRKSIMMSIYIMAPLMIGLATISSSVVTLILTEKWVGCIFYLKLFCISYMFWPIHTANLNAIKALGRSDVFLKLETIKKIIGVIVLLISMQYGVKAIAITELIFSFVAQIINSWPNKKLMNYSYFEQIKDILPSIGIAVIMGIFVHMLDQLGLNSFMRIMIDIVCGAGIYIFLSAMLRLEQYNMLVDLIKNYIKKGEHS